MAKPLLWLLLARLRDPEIASVIPSVAWMAADAGAQFEIYLESEREGRLFAETGSTVLGGHHHQQFNYLCAAFEVHVIRFGTTAIFDSSLKTFGVPVIAAARRPAALYAELLDRPGVRAPRAMVITTAREATLAGQPLTLAPYLFPEILHRGALGGTAREARALAALARRYGVKAAHALFLAADELRAVRAAVSRLIIADRFRRGDDWGRVTLRVARRWRRHSEGVVFGDPPAILSQLATHCRERRVALYQPLSPLPPAAVRVSHYTEQSSPIAAATARLAVELGNRVITGRQTGDGDIFEWSKQGVCIQIIDPNRPAFPVVATVQQPWSPPLPPPGEPTDAQLRAWAAEDRVLTTLVWHSGEVAHNEAMLALVELAGWTGVRMGIGVHAQRYETCPQMWELLNVPPAHGGAAGLIEPLLHAGGLGVMAECNCPPARVAENCQRALERIRRIAGPAGTPRGYYAFMDSNLDRLDRVRGDLFAAIAKTGLDYIVSSALPGRNRLLWRDRAGRVALNQTPRVVHGASPFVRATTPEDLQTGLGASGPGWMIATLDAPVIAFSPYIWRQGGRFLRLIDEELRGPGRINVTPGVIARYARLLAAQGILSSGS